MLIPCDTLLFFYIQGQYKFSYAVDDGYSGNQFGHTENRFGPDTVGAYHVLLPDGRLQTVSYTGKFYLKKLFENFNNNFYFVSSRYEIT